MRSSNPALRESVFRDVSFGGRSAAEGVTEERSSVMTLEGTMAKTSILLLAVTVAAMFTWQKVMAAFDPAAPPDLTPVLPWVMGGLVGGFIVALIISFKPNLAPTLALPYALLEGLFLGAVSAIYAVQFGDQAGLGGSIVFQAVVLTFGTAFAMFALYAFRIIRVTQRLRSIVIAATGGIMLYYLISFVASLMGFGSLPYIHDGGPLGIGLSVFVIGIAAFNLLLDFDIIEKGIQGGAPKSFEWYGAFALIVTLVWLYIEFLRLLAKLRSND